MGLSTVFGAQVPWPYGGKTRVVSVDLDLPSLKAKNLKAEDVVNAFAAQSLILPSGTTKIGPTEYDVSVNSQPRVIEELGDLPIRVVNGATIRVRDVANVRDGYQPQQNVVRQDGQRGALLTILKSGVASTLDVVASVKEAMPRIRAGLTPELEVKEFGDQSLFVRAAVDGVIHEGVIAASLTALMILLFLGSWRSTLIIALPAFVSTLCICIVFVPMFFLTGVARHLFVPLAEAVVFAMLASYVLSRTLIPTLVRLTTDNRIELRRVTLGRDLGAVVEITAGVETTDRLVLNPPDSITAGVEVRVVTPEKKP